MPVVQSPGTLYNFRDSIRRFPEGELARRAKRGHPGVRRFAPRNDRWGDRADSPGCDSRFGAHCGTVDARSRRVIPKHRAGAAASRPPCGDKRLKKNTSLRTSAHTGVAIPKIERNLPLVVPAKSRGLPRACGPRNDVFSFCAGSSICHPSKCRLRRQERRGRRSLRGSL